jgi:hypothetical protein
MTMETLGGQLGQRQGQHDRRHGEHPVGDP